MKKRNPFFVIGTVCLSLMCASPLSAATEQPNFVVIFIDDMGYGDIEPFGSTVNKTPHLNRMAAEGLKLTSFYVAAPLCSPSRAALMTGCYPKRVGLDVGSVYSVLLSKDAHGLNPEEKSIARVLKDAGYATGCFGKWHLGDQPEFLPTNHGFDTFYGLPYSNDIWPFHKWHGKPHPPLPILDGVDVVGMVEDVDDQAHLCKTFTDKAVSFIREHKDEPFFVYLPHPFIHHPRMARKEFLDRAGPVKDIDEEQMLTDSKYLMKQRTRAQIEEVDWSVGQILDCLRELDLAKNTMVVFTSDNGPSSGASSGLLKGRKGSTSEGGMREPTLAWWPETIPANTVCDEITTSMDLLPTFATLGGGEVPSDRVIDGKSIEALLRGDATKKSPHEAFFYYSRSDLKAVRSGEWKLTVEGELFNLDNDISESGNVAAEHPAVVVRLEAYLTACRADLDNPKNCRPVGKNPNPRLLTEKK